MLREYGIAVGNIECKLLLIWRGNNNNNNYRYIFSIPYPIPHVDPIEYIYSGGSFLRCSLLYRSSSSLSSSLTNNSITNQPIYLYIFISIYISIDTTQWLWCKHAVSYNELPSFFLAFDIFDKRIGKYLSTKQFNQLLNNRIPTVPTLYSNSSINSNSNSNVPFDSSLIQSLVSRSKYGKEEAEGLYLRLEDDEYVVDRYKFRRNTFVSGRENFGTEIEKNELASSS